MSQWIVTGSPDERRESMIEPRMEILGDDGRVQRSYLIPTNAHLMVRDGDALHAGDVLAKIPRETTKTERHHGAGSHEWWSFSRQGVRASPP